MKKVTWLLFTALLFLQGNSYLILQPEELRGDAIFLCFLASSNSNITNIQWIVNGSLLGQLTLMDFYPLQSILNFTDGTQVGILHLTDLPSKYNMTCRAELSNPDSETTSTTDPVTLIIFGKEIPLQIPAVDNLFASLEDSNIVYVSWNPPPAVNTANITYCIDVKDRLDHSIQTECTVTETKYKFVLPHKNWCDRYFFFVTPTTTNSNGTRTGVPYLSTISLPQVIDEPKTLTVGDEELISMSAPVCDAELILVDVDFGEIITLARNDITIDYNNIIFTTKHLSNGRTYNIRVIATNIAGSATSCTSINTNINMTMFVAATTTSKIDAISYTSINILMPATPDIPTGTTAIEPRSPLCCQYDLRASDMLVMVTFITMVAVITILSCVIWRRRRKYYSYASSLPASALPHLDQQLNWTDLTEIAHHMLDWEEKLCTHLGLTAVDIHDIKAKHQNNPKLQRREALERWKDDQGVQATYGNLLEVFQKAKHSQCAEVVCELLKKKATSICPGPRRLLMNFENFKKYKILCCVVIIAIFFLVRYQT